MANKDDIDKIDEQIKSLSEGPNEEEEKDISEEESGTRVVDDIKELETEPVQEKEEIEEEKEEPVEEKEEPVEEKEEEQIATKVDPENLPEEKKEEPKAKSKKIIIALVVGIVLLLMVLILAVTALSGKKRTIYTKDKELTQAEKKEIIEEYGEALQGIISIYLEKKELLLDYEDAIQLVKYDHTVECDVHEIYEDGNIYLNKCTIDEEEVKYSYGKKQEKAEVKEGAIKVYVHKKTKKATLEEPKEKKEYDVYSFDIEEKYTSLTLMGEKSDYVAYINASTHKTHIYNYKTKEKAIPDLVYEQVMPIIVNGELDTKYIAVQKNENWGVYNLETGAKVVPISYILYYSYGYGNNGLTGFKAIDDGLLPIISTNRGDGFVRYGVINYRTNKFVIPCNYKTLQFDGGYVWGYDDYGDFHMLDLTGKEPLANQFDKIYYVVDGKYVLVLEHQEIKVVTDKGKELYNYGELEVGNFNYGLGYKGGAVYNFGNPKADPEDAKGNCLELLYDPDTKKGEVKQSYCGGIAKPILYLYPEKTTKVTVEFEHPEYLETTYPKFVNRWEVTAKKNGDLTDKDGKYYYGLYWDEKQVHKVDFSTGFYVTKENAIDFLEEKLSYIGLNDRERNEFITYWLPILEKNEQSLVYFELTEERENVNKIKITPQPDSLLRIVIHIKKVDQKVEIKKESLTKFRRKGFAAVEWGGTTY